MNEQAGRRDDADVIEEQIMGMVALLAETHSFNRAHTLVQKMAHQFQTALSEMHGPTRPYLVVVQDNGQES